MFCPNCGTNVQGGLEVCPECGTEISVRRNHGGGGNDPFIIAEYENEMNAPHNISLSENDDNTQQSMIIEAEEDELPDEYELTTEDGRQTALAGDVPITSARDAAGRIILGDGFRTEKDERETGRKGDKAVVAIPDDQKSRTEKKIHDLSPASTDDEPHFTVHSGDMSVTKASDDAEQKPHPSDAYPSTELSAPSGKRPRLIWIAIIIFVVLGLAILVYGLPG